MADHNRFLYLLTSYRDGTCTGEEYDEFFSLILTNTYDEVIKQQVSDDYVTEIKAGSDLPPHIAQEIIRNILSADNKVRQIVPPAKKYASLYKWVAAACIVALVVISSVFYFDKNESAGFVALIPSSDVVKENTSSKAIKEVLSDGSVVVLEPGSKIHYPSSFTGNQREVYLYGNAHFNISHDAEKPFLVYCNDLVTKVLGTSFDIYTNAANGEVEVAVRTGRVQVYQNKELQEQKNKNTDAVILTANQRVVYSAESGKILPTLVKNPAPIINIEAFRPDSVDVNQLHIDLKPVQAFVYDQQSLDVVFDDIQKVYDIDVVVENSNIYNCVFTGDVSDKDLFVLLKIICLSTNSDYEVMGTKILVKGKGCRR